MKNKDHSFFFSQVVQGFQAAADCIGGRKLAKILTVGGGAKSKN
jgi:hypothetical protein